MLTYVVLSSCLMGISFSSMGIHTALCSPIAPPVHEGLIRNNRRTPVLCGSVFTRPLRFQRDDEFFRQAADLLQQRTASIVPWDPRPPEQPAFLLRAIASARDTHINFSTAVMEPVLFALHALTGQSWSCGSIPESMGSAVDVQGDGNRVAVISVDTHFVLSDDVWAAIDAYVDGTDPQGNASTRAVSALRHVWTESERCEGPSVFALSSYLRIMLFYRAAGSDVMQCSRIHKNDECGQDSVRFVLAATIFAAAPIQCVVTFEDLERGCLPSAADRSNSGDVINEDERPANTDPPAATSTFTAHATFSKDILTLRSDVNKLPIPLMAFARAAGDGTIPYDQLRLPVPADVTVEDITIREVKTYTPIGFVACGDAHGVPVYVKFCELADKRQALVDEVVGYALLERAGFADFVPVLHGMWYDEANTFLVVGSAGSALKKWSDLNEEQWDAFTKRLHELHEAGFHHGSTEPRNVCVDMGGRVRLIDLERVEECHCHDDESDTECDEMTALRHDSGREIRFDTGTALQEDLES